MDRKIENAEWKQARIKKYRKRNVISICILTLVPFVFALFAYILTDRTLLIISGIDTVLFAILNCQSAKRLQSLSQMTMVYKLSDKDFANEWNDYCTTVDYTLTRQYNEKHKGEK